MNGKSRLKERALSTKTPTRTSQFKPKINKKVPEFDDIHRNLYKEIGQRRNDRMATVCKPFKLHHTEPKNIYSDMQHDEDILNESRWPYTNPRSKPKFRYSLSGIKKLNYIKVELYINLFRQYTALNVYNNIQCF